MTLIINIPDDEYKTLKTKGAWNSGLIECVKNGTPLDDVKAEIQDRIANEPMTTGEEIGMKKALNTIDKYIDKAERR